ncbi:hypothetical protein GCM10011399_03830 [Subtercola lobariae]|uniref:Uncharacterized protein n=2 Tax=Subtercola lobariae TaxID=1588641 RepID=A0A917EVP8_9MICO|nr:hypothetical protein GCM10011399_03830 [Subtercola lobariae]
MGGREGGEAGAKGGGGGKRRLGATNVYVRHGGRSNMSSRWARVLRGLTAAFVAVFVAGFSHVVGGGEAPGTVGVALALAFSAVVCVALAGKTLSLVRLAIAVAFSQLAFHLLFSVGAGAGVGASSGGAVGGVGGGEAVLPGGGSSGGSSGGMAGMGMGGGIPGMGLGTGTGMSGMPGMSHGVGAATGTGNGLFELLSSSGAPPATSLTGAMAAGCDYMWVAHIVAGLITVLALRRGQQAFFGLYEGARMHVLRLVRIPFVEPLRARALEVAAVRRDPDHPTALIVLIGHLRHRGPPQWQFSLL